MPELGTRASCLGRTWSACVNMVCLCCLSSLHMMYHIAGMGKTACALWLSRHVESLDRIWLFVSLPSVKDPFTPNALLKHVAAMLGYRESDDVFIALKKKPMVWILDSLDEVPIPDEDEVEESWWRSRPPAGPTPHTRPTSAPRPARAQQIGMQFCGIMARISLFCVCNMS